MTARQAILVTPMGPVGMNETGNRQANVGGDGLNETGGAGPAPPGTTTVFHTPICSVGAMMNHSS